MPLLQSKGIRVADSTQPDVSSVIESAMSRLAPGNDPANARKNLGRRDYDLALAKRLEQLRTAMGEDAPAEKTPAAPTASPASAPGRTFAAGTLAATALLSALAGAGLMWLARANDTPAPAKQTKPISIAPAATVPPPIAIPVAAAPTPIDSTEDEVRKRLESWRQAWASRESEAYLRHYSPDFIPADGQKHADWAAARRKNLASRSDIDVQVRELRIEKIDDERLKASFLQDYASGNYREKAQEKTLLFVRRGSDWLIAGEWQGMAPRLGPPK
jgi:hypothetical protein